MALSREFVLLSALATIVMMLVFTATYSSFTRSQENIKTAMLRETIVNGFESVKELPVGSFVVIDLPVSSAVEIRNMVDSEGDPYIYVKVRNVIEDFYLIQIVGTNGTVITSNRIFIRKVGYDSSTGVTYIKVSGSSYSAFEQEYLSGSVVTDISSREHVANITFYPDGNSYVNQTISIKIPYIDGMRDDFGDLLFTDDSDNLIPFYVREYVPKEYVVVDLKIPYISPTSTTLIKMYYGNNNIKYYGNPNDVYMYYSDFRNDNFSCIDVIGDFDIVYDSLIYSYVLNMNQSSSFTVYSNYSAVFFTTLNGSYISMTRFRADSSSYTGIVYATPTYNKIIEVGVENNKLYYTYITRGAGGYNVTRYYYTFDIVDPDYIDLKVTTENVNGINQVTIDVNGIVVSIDENDVDGNMLNFNQQYIVGVFSTNVGARFDYIIVMQTYPQLTSTISY